MFIYNEQSTKSETIKGMREFNYSNVENLSVIHKAVIFLHKISSVLLQISL